MKHEWMTLYWEGAPDKPIRAKCICKTCGQRAWVYDDKREEMLDTHEEFPAKAECSGVQEVVWRA